MNKSAIYCEHANEVPVTCPCDDDCYCKEHSCKPGPPLRIMMKCPKCSGPAFQRKGFHFDHEYFCSKCNHIWEPMSEIEPVEDLKSFREELCDLINCHSKENGSDTPDFILAEYLTDCLEVFDKANRKRTVWYSDE